ncbi:MAG: PAS domain S-box protein [Actinomycetota bacterium]
MDIFEPGVDTDAYRIFFLESPRPMYVFDLKSYAILDANDAAVELYGYTRDELHGMTTLDLRAPAEIPRLMEYLRQGTLEPEVWRHRRKDGSSIELEAAWSRFPYRGREARLVVFTDVSRREQAFRELEASEDRFRTAIDTVLGGFMTLTAVRDDDGEIVDFAFDFVNEDVTRFLRRPASEVVGLTLEMVPESRIRPFRDRLIRVVEEAKPFHESAAETTQRGPDGEIVTRVFDISAAKLRDGVAVNFRDVTEAAAAGEALRESEELFRTVVEASPLGIVLVAPDLRVLEANPAFCRLLGYDAATLQAMTFPDFTHPADVDIDVGLATQLFAGEITHYSLEKRFLTASGELVWIKLTAAAMFDEHHRGLAAIGIVEDINDAKVGEERLRQEVELAGRRLALLTPREREVLDAALEGLTARQIADRFTVSARTTESHLASVYRKLGVGSRDAALRQYSQMLDAIGGSPTAIPVRPPAP